jgi:transcriptional regulator with XRE-family HTH domain
MSAIHKHRRLLGEAVRAERKAAGLSQEKLAEKADLSTVFISRVERGKESPSVDNLVKIAKALSIRVRDLVEQFWILGNPHSGGFEIWNKKWWESRWQILNYLRPDQHKQDKNSRPLGWFPHKQELGGFWSENRAERVSWVVLILSWVVSTVGVILGSRIGVFTFICVFTDMNTAARRVMISERFFSHFFWVLCKLLNIKCIDNV